jgi:ubiquinone/menaquinone biosynthesis C-methylase UbiE
MSNEDRGQVSRNAAEVYEEFFVPALFQEWASRVVDAVHIQPSQKVLDVACGTGVVARTALERVGTTGQVVGLDVNEGMLAVAARTEPHIDWRRGKAEALPFDNASFDAVLCQFGLMFFEDRRAAIKEMVRVLRPGGNLAVAVWHSLDNTPGYAAMVELLQRLFGTEAANGLRFPFSLGDMPTLRSLFDDIGLDDNDIRINTLPGTAHFPSIESWVYTDIKGWVLADQFDDAQYEQLLREAKQSLAPFVEADGQVRFASPAHIVSATKR